MRVVNLVGKRFGRLVVIKVAEKDKRGQSCWSCKCNCDKIIIVLGYNLKSGNTKSCGCLFGEGNNTQHGHTKNGKESGIHRSWSSMIRRCNDPKHKSYHRYGKQGIKVHERWMKFENFNEDMGKSWKSGLQIDRKNNSKGYYKSNCRWATPKQQQRNRENNRSITHNGKTQLLIEWSEETDIPYDTLRYRIVNAGWTAERALTTPVRGKK